MSSDGSYLTLLDSDSDLIDEDWIRELENENVITITSRSFPRWSREQALLKVEVADGAYKYVSDLSGRCKCTVTSNVDEAAKYRVEGNADGVFYSPEMTKYFDQLEFSRKSIGEKSYLMSTFRDLDDNGEEQVKEWPYWIDINETRPMELKHTTTQVGKMGMTVDPATGIVNDVIKNGAAERKGVKVGWQALKMAPASSDEVDEDFTLARLQELEGSGKQYSIRWEAPGVGFWTFRDPLANWRDSERRWRMVEVEIVAGGTFYKAYQWITSKLRPTDNRFFTELDYEAYTKIACFYDAWLRDPAGLIEIMQEDVTERGLQSGEDKKRERKKLLLMPICRRMYQSSNPCVAKLSRRMFDPLSAFLSFIRLLIRPSILGTIVCCLGLPFAYGSFMLDACTDEQFADNEASCDLTAFLQSWKALLLVPVSGLLVLLVSLVIKSLVYVGACVSPQKAAALRRFLTKHFYDTLVIQKLPHVVGTPETMCIMLYFSEAVAFLLLAAKQKSVAALALVPAVTNMFMVLADAVLGRPVYVGLAEKLKLKDMLAECIDEVESENQGVRQSWTTTGSKKEYSIASSAILLAEIIRLKDHGGTGSRNDYMPFMMKRLDPSYPDQRGLAQVEKSEIVRSLERLLMHSPNNPEFQIPRWVALALSSWMPSSLNSVPLRLHLFYDHETGISADLDALAVQKWGRASGKGYPSRRQIVEHFFVKLTKFIAAVKAPPSLPEKEQAE